MKRGIYSHLIGIFVLLTFQAEFHAQTFSTHKGLVGETVDKATALQFGPDDRLYVLDLSGDIHIYSIERTPKGQYEVSDAEIIDQVRLIRNHNDDGTVNETDRRVATGICVAGTASNPVIYVTSSDFRVAAFMEDLHVDTNSGTISRLTWNGTSWDHIILVRGLPRSEENHATNDLIYVPEEHKLYVAQGGNTNAGSPSPLTFVYLCETAYAAAILEVDLAAIEAMPVKTDPASGHRFLYDLPTVDDPMRSNANGIDDPDHPDYDGIDINDPFGGNDGLNQAKLTVGSPVQVYSGGYRNAYDILRTELGEFYTWDNGPSRGWGGPPVAEGIGTSTNEYVPTNLGRDIIDADGLHHITHRGYYAGHPNPIRANPSGAGWYTHDGLKGVWRTQYLPDNPFESLPYDWPPVDPELANPNEGVYLGSGTQDASICNVPESTNGIAEYTASNFDGALKGDILAVGFESGDVYRVDLDQNGKIRSPEGVSKILFPSGVPLDITTLGDNGPFPGTIWIARFNASQSVFVYEPDDHAF